MRDSTNHQSLVSLDSPAGNEISRYCFKHAILAAAALGAFTASALLLAAEEEAGGPVLEEIVVTAQKREESLQTVAISATAFSSETRDLIGIETIQDLTNYTPGVQYNEQNDLMYVRGIGRTSNNLALDPAVATYLDGFYSSFNRVADSSSLFLAQEEIYRGPQGTLFGRNAIGGVFNLTSPAPSYQWEGESRLRIGNYDSADLESTVSGPITDSLRFRLTLGDYQQDQGFFRSVSGHNEDGYGLKHTQEYKLQLAGNVGSSFDWSMKADHREWNLGWGTLKQLTPYSTGASPTYDCAVLACPGNLGPNPQYSVGVDPLITQPGPTQTDSRVLNTDTPNRERLKNDMVYVFQGVGHLGFADLKYIAGFYSYDYDLEVDFDNTTRTSYVYQAPFNTQFGFQPSPVTINSQMVSHYQEVKHYYSNELNLVSATDGELQYVVGLYQFDEHFRNPFGIGSVVPQPQVVTPTVLTNGVPGGPAPMNPRGLYYFADDRTVGQSAAAFGQIDWLFVDTVKATVGLRYTTDRKSSEDIAREVFYDPSGLGAQASAYDLVLGTQRNADGDFVRPLEIDSHAFTGTAGLEWTPTQRTLGYLKYSRGYKDAGINAGSGFAANPYTQPEYVDALEIGWKQTVERTLQLNSSVFYDKYKGAQYPLTQLTQFTRTSAFFNIDEKIYGAEFEVQWAATEHFRILLDYAYLKAMFTDRNTFADAFTGLPTSLYGNPVPQSPRNKATLNTIYSWGFEPGSLSLSGTYAWKDRITSSAFSDPEFTAGSFGVTDFRATWNAISDRWSVLGYLRNAFNVLASDKGVVSGGGTTFGTPTTLFRSYIPPRTFGIELKVRFGAKIHQ
jgi:iron complex outermembrane recepter protein